MAKAKASPTKIRRFDIVQAMRDIAHPEIEGLGYRVGDVTIVDEVEGRKINTKEYMCFFPASAFKVVGRCVITGSGRQLED